jgi:hypothetical protein
LSGSSECVTILAFPQTFLGADTRQISFLESNGQPKAYSLTDVQGITFAAIPTPTASVPLPKPTNATLLAGALIPVRMVTSLDTSRTKTGDLFNATLDSNLVAGGVVVAPRGTTVNGKVINSENARRLTGKSELQIELTNIVINGTAQTISTSGFQQKGASEGAQPPRRPRVAQDTLAIPLSYLKKKCRLERNTDGR